MIDYLLSSITSRVGAKTCASRPYILGVTGADASGKSQLAAILQRELIACGYTTHLIHVDDFHYPRAHRYAGNRPEPEKFRYQSIDFHKLRNEVLVPLRAEGVLHREFHLLDIPTDEYTLIRRYDIDPDSIVIVEGVFLLGEELRELIDDLICLVVSDEELIRRGIQRDSDLLGADARRRFEEKYLPAQRALFAQYPPEKYASLVIDNEDYQNPRLVSGW